MLVQPLLVLVVDLGLACLKGSNLEAAPGP
jgi:hypothetical protein